MKASLENTTVKDISYLIHTASLRASDKLSLENLASMLCGSDRYKVYLENAEGQLVGVIQAKQIAIKILELSRQKEDEPDMLPAIAYVLNFFCGRDLAEPLVSVNAKTPLKLALELMQRNCIREIPVVDENDHLIGTLEAKNILAHYLNAKIETEI